MSPAERVQRARAAIASLIELRSCVGQWRTAIEAVWEELTDANGDSFPGMPADALGKLLSAAALFDNIYFEDEIVQLSPADARDLELALAQRSAA